MGTVPCVLVETVNKKNGRMMQTVFGFRMLLLERRDFSGNELVVGCAACDMADMMVITYIPACIHACCI